MLSLLHRYMKSITFMSLLCKKKRNPGWPPKKLAFSLTLQVYTFGPGSHSAFVTNR